MPEISEVRHCADVLNQDLANCIITKYSLDLNKINSKYHPNGPNNLNLVVNSKIKKIYSVGKKIIFVLVTPQGQDIYMVSALLMTGKWLYQAQKYTSLCFECYEIKPKFLLHKKNLYYDDMRRFGLLDIYLNITDLNNFLKEKVGPNFLDDNITPEIYKKALQKSNQQISVFMLDQTKFAGIGNYLRAEILYLAQVNPFKTCKTITDQEIERILFYTKEVIDKTYKAGGLTFSDYKDPYDRSGNYDTLVYQKKVCPKGYAVKTDKTSDNRVIHWVSEIQI